MWVRRDDETGKRHQRYQRRFEEKESYKWVKGLSKRETPDSTPGYVVVCDAEAHIYEFLDALFERALDFMLRAADARSFTDAAQALFEVIAQQAVQQRFTLALKRRPDREAREAELELLFSQITLKRPLRAIAKWAPSPCLWSMWLNRIRQQVKNRFTGC